MGPRVSKCAKGSNWGLDSSRYYSYWLVTLEGWINLSEPQTRKEEIGLKSLPASRLLLLECHISQGRVLSVAYDDLKANGCNYLGTQRILKSQLAKHRNNQFLKTPQ